MKRDAILFVLFVAFVLFYLRRTAPKGSAEAWVSGPFYPRTVRQSQGLSVIPYHVGIG